MRSFHFGGKNLTNNASYALDQYITLIASKSQLANRMVPSAGAFGYQQCHCRKSRSKLAEFGFQYFVQRLECRAISTSAELLAFAGNSTFTGAQWVRDVGRVSAATGGGTLCK